MSGIKYRSLLLRGNRLLGSALVSAGLISEEAQQSASQRLLEVIQAENLKQAGLLYILLFDMHTLVEADLLNHMVERGNIGLIDLHNYTLETTFDRTLDLELCWSTWTLPYDKVEGVNFVATAYYLSEPIRKHWEGLLQGPILWYACPLGSIMDALERLNATATVAKA
ncbi:MAG: hypothetical protein SFY80_17700 [Verrucomicrobiota bacterium]|nr:hypothetical protein [Verrucomicrobiota bacterium]